MTAQSARAFEIVDALAQDSRAAWDDFVTLASGPVWRAAIRAAPRRAEAERLFLWIMDRLFEARHDLPARRAQSRIADAAAFLEQEIDRQLCDWMLELFHAGAAEAAEVLVRLFARDIRLWVARATPAQAQSSIEDRVQEVLLGLLAQDARRIRAYGGSAPLRAYLRRVCVNLAIEMGRRESGRVRPGDDPARSARPRLVSIEGGDTPLDLPGEGPDGETALLDREELVQETLRFAMVEEALQNLPPEVRRILHARFVDGQKPRDIAQSEGRDVKEIYRILERTLAQLKTSLGGRTA